MKGKIFCLVLLFFLAFPIRVFASGGWYLMLPPPDLPPLYDNAEAPIKKWQQYESFDSAKECENGRMRHINNSISLESRFEKLQGKGKKDYSIQVEMAKGEFSKAMSALCIATDDPRLK